ncbi:hypothetical protein BDP27DRAFT_1325412 [Rhodocollybia butyracea]|uniref:Uncharacterized protein n=1 Tax=Rhodocollybia butyracea TaxID=206335 RepID=A0A9P5PUC4_9AGAR|nr:hypothetical protein BDP27DRAFT_1325412 [Rhodocollybia butyracea]
MLHVCNLWERKRRLVVLSIILFVFTQAASVACASITLPNLIHIASFNEKLKACTVPQRFSVFSMWVPALFFELAMITIVLWNRTLREECSTKLVCRDELLYFAIVSTLRIVNVVLAAVIPVPLIFLGVLFVWCSTTVTVSRLVLRLRRVNVQKKLLKDSEYETIGCK